MKKMDSVVKSRLMLACVIMLAVVFTTLIPVTISAYAQTPKTTKVIEN